MARFIFLPSIHSYTSIKELYWKKMILIIGLFYPSLHSNPRNPPIKAFMFSLLIDFSLILSPNYLILVSLESLFHELSVNI